MQVQPAKRRLIRWLPLVALVLLLGPFVMLNLWNHPSADDFSYATYLAERGLWQNTIWYFLHWSGRYISNTVTSLTPLAVSINAGSITATTLFMYRLVSLGMTLALAGSLWYLFSTLNRWYLLQSRRVLGGIYLSVLTALLLMLASAAELFYWYPASVAYCLPFILLFVSIAFLVRWHKTRSDTPAGRRTRNKLLAGMVALAIIQIGTQEMSLMVVMVSLLALGVLAGGVLGRGRVQQAQPIRRLFAILFSSALVASLFAVAAPGNYARKAIWLQRGYGEIDFMTRLVQWVQDLVRTFAETVTAARLLAVIAIALPLLIMLAFSLARRFKPISPLWSIGLLAAYWVGMSLPGLAASSPELLGAGRTVNTYNIVLVLMLFVIVTHVLWFMFARLRVYLELLAPIALVMVRAMRLKLAWSVFAALLFVWIVVAPSSNISVAWRNVLSGSAVHYDQQLLDRYTELKNASEPEVVVDALSDAPKTIFFDDITDNPLDWRNTSYARFFQRESVVLGEPARN